MANYTKRPDPVATGVMLVKISDVKKITSKNNKPGIDFTFVVLAAPDERLKGMRLPFNTFYLPEDPEDESSGAIFQVNRFINFVGAITDQKTEEGTRIDTDDMDLLNSLKEEMVTVQIEKGKPYGTPPRDSFNIVAFYPADQYEVEARRYIEQLDRQKAAQGARF